MCIHAIFPLNVYIVNLSVSQGSSILKVGKSVDTLVLKCYTKKYRERYLSSYYCRVKSNSLVYRIR